jgi:hypothetical protein
MEPVVPAIACSDRYFSELYCAGSALCQLDGAQEVDSICLVLHETYEVNVR